MDITDQHLLTLVGVNKHYSFREIASTLGRSIGTVQQRMDDLVKEGYLIKPEKSVEKSQARGYALTPQGKEVLAKNNLL